MKELKITMEQLSQRKFIRDKNMPYYGNRASLQQKNEEAKALLDKVGLPDFEKLRKK
ncbi:hypothetical protein GA0116948_11881 [Chitinophaga costaii]|uniref:Uncharacterized protein n=1 Tax=Chitinophaga costaii TaxID=1335309 RepID=A0A1C4FZI4_9BACT|nr:hypothetical protein [Chitinophaga costaii]SCC61282.1 hypothetical protein GA0116948_11881 [Chitinophaga costaii]